MLKNIFMAQLGFELTTSATPPSTALSVTSTDCAIETYIYIYIYIYIVDMGLWIRSAEERGERHYENGNTTTTTNCGKLTNVESYLSYTACLGIFTSIISTPDKKC